MLTGGCQCGAVRYRITADPIRIYVCHCTECRAQSASAFGISVIVASDAFRLVQGHPKSWSRQTATDKRLECRFCPDCGTRLWHGNTPDDGVVSVKGGSLDAARMGGLDLGGAAHIWTRSKLPGILIPEGARQWPENQD